MPTGTKKTCIKKVTHIDYLSVNRQKRRVGEALVRPLGGSQVTLISDNGKLQYLIVQDFQYSFEGMIELLSFLSCFLLIFPKRQTKKHLINLFFEEHFIYHLLEQKERR